MEEERFKAKSKDEWTKENVYSMERVIGNYLTSSEYLEELRIDHVKAARCLLGFHEWFEDCSDPPTKYSPKDFDGKTAKDILKTFTSL